MLFEARINSNRNAFASGIPNQVKEKHGLVLKMLNFEIQLSAKIDIDPVDKIWKFLFNFLGDANRNSLHLSIIASLPKSRKFLR